MAFVGGAMLARFWWYLDRLSPHPLSKKRFQRQTPLEKLFGSMQDAQTRLSLQCKQTYDVRTISIL